MTTYDYRDYLKLALYTNQTAVNNDYMSFSEGVLLNGAIGAGIEGVRYGGGKVKNLVKKPTAEALAQKQKEIQEIKKLKGKNVWETYRNSARYNTIKDYGRSLPAKPKAMTRKEVLAMPKKAQQARQKASIVSKFYDNPRQLLEEAKSLRGAAQAKKIKEFEKALAQAKLDAYNAGFKGALKPTKFMGKAKNVASTVSGVRAAKTTSKFLLANSSKLRYATKLVKGNAVFTALSVAADYEKFQETEKICGKTARNNEIAKSTAVAAVEAVGFWAGMKAGAAIGTAVGTAVPGVGNIVGGVAGAVIGGLLSWGAGKVAHSCMGKSEIQKHNEKQAELMALKAKYNTNTRQTLLRKTAFKLQADFNNAQASPEELEAAGLQPVDEAKLEDTTRAFQRATANDPEFLAQLEQELIAAEQQAEQE